MRHPLCVAIVLTLSSLTGQARGEPAASHPGKLNEDLFSDV